MPVFDFKCQECGHKFDIVVSNRNKDQVKCPNCGADKVQQLLSAFSSPRSSGSLPESCSGCASAGSGG